MPSRGGDQVDRVLVALEIACPTCGQPEGVVCGLDGVHFARLVKGEAVAGGNVGDGEQPASPVDDEQTEEAVTGG